MASVLNNVVYYKKVKAQSSDEKYNYDITYEIANSDMTLVLVSINVSSKEGGAYVGNMSYSNNNQYISAPYTSDMTLLSTMFDSVIAEIKSNLQPVAQ